MKYKCWFSDQYYTVTPGCSYQSFSEICTNDPHSYQVCGFQTCDNYEHSDNHYCGGYVCDIFNMFYFTCSNPSFSNYVLSCNTITQCKNGADEMYCDHTKSVQCKYIYPYNNVYIDENQICNGAVDCPGSGEDEMRCNHTIGIECMPYVMILITVLKVRMNKIVLDTTHLTLLVNGVKDLI